MKALIMTVISVSLVLFAMFFDAGSRSDYQYTAKLVDKWHEESCVPMFGGDGQYMGESCSDDYTLVLNVDGKRVKQFVSNSKFRTFKIGQPVIYRYWLGRLGFKHSVEIQPVTLSQFASPIHS